MAELHLADFSVFAGGHCLVHGAALTLRPGELVAVIGENGSGKSSLLRGITGFLASRGTCQINGQALSAMAPRDRARMMAWLPQQVPLALPIRVADAVALGRYAYGATPRRMTEADQRAVKEAMRACGIETLGMRETSALSGGELARVHIARAFASEAPLLLADEPVAALDPRHRLAVMRLIRARADAGSAALIVLHDLELAARFADRIIGMKAGGILVDGPPHAVVTAEWIERLYGVTAQVDSQEGWPRPRYL